MGSWRQAPEQLDLILGQGRAERRDGFAEARFGQRDDVHVAFDDDDAVLVVGGGAGAWALKSIAPFVKERRLRRVQVFGRRIGIERAAAEGDDAAFEVGIGKHDAVAEAVVGHGDIVAADQHARRSTMSADEKPALPEMRLSADCASSARSPDGSDCDRLARRGRACRDSGAPRRPGRRASCPRRTRPKPRASDRAASRWSSCSHRARAGFGIGTPASAASRSTASGNARPSVFITKVKMSPCSPEAKQ